MNKNVTYKIIWICCLVVGKMRLVISMILATLDQKLGNFEGNISKYDAATDYVSKTVKKRKNILLKN
jgi:hypothetical protein